MNGHVHVHTRVAPPHRQRPKPHRRKQEEDLTSSLARSAEKAARLAAAEEELEALRRTPMSSRGGAGDDNVGRAHTEVLQAELEAHIEERDALLQLKRERALREQAEAELHLARTRSAEKKRQLAAAKNTLHAMQLSQPPPEPQPEADDPPPPPSFGTPEALAAQLSRAEVEQGALLEIKRGRDAAMRQDAQARSLAEASLSAAVVQEGAVNAARTAMEYRQYVERQLADAEAQRDALRAELEAAQQALLSSDSRDLVSARAERDALLVLKREKEARERAEEQLELARTRSAAKKAELAAAKAKLQAMEQAAGTAAAPATGPQPSMADLKSARAERDALLVLKREKEARERAEEQLELARTRSAAKKAELAAAKAKLRAMEQAGVAGNSADGQQDDPALEKQVRALKMERDALLELKREKEQRERAEAELARASTRSVCPNAFLACGETASTIRPAVTGWPPVRIPPPWVFLR
jgi:hypothetical protein